MIFTWSGKELTEEQDIAVKEENNAIVIACPGSGKTRTLIYKSAYELSKLADNKKYIIAIIYTNIAADEIKERIELLGVDTTNLWIGTIHSFCLDWVLRPYSSYCNFTKYGFHIIDPQTSDRLKNELCQEKDINPFNVDWSMNSSGFRVSGSETIKEIRKKYLSILKNNNEIDFNLILFLSNWIVYKYPQVGKILSNIFSYILIDEYQDTQELQYSIIGKIIKEGINKPKLFIVGDPDQAIFQGLGGYAASKDEIEQFTGVPIKELYLTQNFRSSSKICNYFKNFQSTERQIIPKGKLIKFNSKITYNDQVILDDLVVHIADKIRQEITSGILQNEICVVAPQWIHLASLTRSLIAQMPDLSFNGPGMTPFDRRIENFWYKVTRIALTEPAPNMYLRRLLWAKEILYELVNNGVLPVNHSFTPRLLLRISNGIRIDEQNGLEYLRLFFDELSLKMNLDFQNNNWLSEHHDAFFERSKNRIERLSRESGNFIEDIAAFKSVFKTKDGITISSIHGVKGTEFDTVIAFALLEGYVPHPNDNNGDDTSKKMLYVVASRAKKHLHIICEQGRPTYFDWETRERYPRTPNRHLVYFDYEYDNIKDHVGNNV